MVSGSSGASVDVTLGPRDLVAALRSCVTVLRDHAAALDGLDASDPWDDVAPTGAVDSSDVALPIRGPAGDPGPGSDLGETLAGACDAVGDDSNFSVVSERLVEGARSAARTDAGDHLAAFLAGASDVLRNADGLDGARLALALEAGAERVTESDDGTHPGCLLAVMAATADGALGAADAAGGLAEVLVSAAEAGLVELEQGPVADARLAARGTVDGAAAGFLLILDSLAAIVSGDPLPEPPRQVTPPLVARPGQRFVVRCQVTPPVVDVEVAAELEVVLHELTERLVLERAGGRWVVDVVTTLPGPVVESLAGTGVLSELDIAVVEQA